MNSTEKLDRSPINSIFIIVVVSTLVLFFFSSLRHSLFQSGAWDLGIFDQGVYLISQGLLPISSFTDFHILADHAAFILYPLSIFYKIYPDIHWLLLIQAVALASGAIPVYKLALQQGASNNQGYLLSLIYVLSPLIFNANLFDFHPDVIAVPFFLWSVLFARTSKILLFFLALVMILSCKAVFAITVAAMGIWLALFEKRKLMGLIAILVGIVWLIIATQILIPLIGGESASTVRHIGRYASLGNSYSAILINLFLKPHLFINKIFSIDSFVYLLLLFTPFIWFLKNVNLSPLLVAIPTIAMSILSDDPAQRYLANQYPLPVLPFLMLIAIAKISSMEFQKNWYFRFIVFWAVLAFVIMSRLNLFTGQYLNFIDTWNANNEAIAMIKTKGSILTTHEISPHVSQRLVVNLSFSSKNYNLENFDYILLNTRHPGDFSDLNYALSLVEQATKIPRFKLEYQKDAVYLFTKYSL